MTARPRPTSARSAWTTARSRSGQRIRRKPVHELTGLGARRGDRPRGARGDPPEPGGRVPGHHRWRGGFGVSTAGLTLRQVRFTNKAFWRNPASAFFTFAFPLMFLVIFTALLGGGDLPIQGVQLAQSTYYVGAMATFGVISACFTNIAMSVVLQPGRRDPEAHPRDAAAGLGVPRRTCDPRHDRRRDPRRHHAHVRAALLPGDVPDRAPAAGAHRDVPGGCALVRRPRARGHRDRSQRRCGAADRERDRPAAPVPLGDLHPDRRQRATVDQDRRQRSSP